MSQEPDINMHAMVLSAYREIAYHETLQEMGNIAPVQNARSLERFYGTLDSYEPFAEDVAYPTQEECETAEKSGRARAIAETRQQPADGVRRRC